MQRFPSTWQILRVKLPSEYRYSDSIRFARRRHTFALYRCFGYCGPAPLSLYGLKKLVKRGNSWAFIPLAIWAGGGGESRSPEFITRVMCRSPEPVLEFVGSIAEIESGVLLEAPKLWGLRWPSFWSASACARCQGSNLGGFPLKATVHWGTLQDTGLQSRGLSPKGVGKWPKLELSNSIYVEILYIWIRQTGMDPVACWSCTAVSLNCRFPTNVIRSSFSSRQESLCSTPD